MGNRASAEISWITRMMDFRRPNAVRILAVSIPFLIAGCGQSPRPAAESPSTPDRRFEDLKYSKFCSESAETFWKRWKQERWNQAHKPQAIPFHEITFSERRWYTSHYNNQYNRCFVDIHFYLMQKNGDVTEVDDVYDALDGQNIGTRRILDWGSGGRKRQSIFLDRGSPEFSSRVVPVTPTPEDLSWFEDLMSK
jgi:hypothetical protein